MAKHKKSPGAQLQVAQEHHRAGRLKEAEAQYRKILRSAPDDAETLYSLGMLNYELGRKAPARDFLSNAVRRNPEHFGAQFNLANAYKEEGMCEKAIEHFRKAIGIRPDFAPAYNNLGNLLRDEGDTDGAETQFRQAIKLNPKLVSVNINLGNLLQAKGELDAALSCLRVAEEVGADNYLSHFYLAGVLAQKGDEQGATNSFQKAIQLNSDFAPAYNDLGTMYYKRDDLVQAERYYRMAQQRDPKCVEASNNLGCVLLDQGEHDEALACINQAIAIDPENVNAYYNLGNTQRALRNLGVAISCYKKALELQPDHVGANWEMALALLLMGEFTRGWIQYAWRLKRKEHAQRPFTQPLWEGHSLDGMTILIHGEQGVGDEITFASCFAEMIERAARVIIECDPRLQPLFQRSFPDAICVGRPQDGDVTWAQQFAPVDFQVHAGSLPRFLRPDLNSFPVQQQYLLPGPKQREEWQQRLAALGAGLKIGISWQGGVTASARNKRSTTLDQWAELFGMTGIHLINLQYGDCVAEIATAQERFGVTIHDWPDADPLTDLDNFAAQVSALDLVISIDNSTVHMAGALGVPTWVLQPYVPEWRWLLHRTDSPWYGSVRQFRQTSLANWESVFRTVSEALQHRLAMDDSS